MDKKTYRKDCSSPTKDAKQPVPTVFKPPETQHSAGTLAAGVSMKRLSISDKFDGNKCAECTMHPNRSE